ncbi:hypothetical protein [Phenylobacterium parvum]|uniref:Lipoprotein n=1 Tax=Phenylobacterium parvum TaxID=2201350 RepID=A0A2Z3I2Z4_9CAUL|nr:hypothetical protein [Phenylobacterium parvum]AWM77834.1 hypothetical protein HYN04_08695 [Phenylobacterium parvum]
MRAPITLVALVALAALSACAKRIEPPGTPGTCYHVQPTQQGLKYNPLPTAQPDLEHCAAALEAMRIRFLNMGGNQTNIAGAYQGNFLFLVPAGIYTSTSWEGNRFLALVRSGDGRLVLPGAMPMAPGG